MPNKSSITKATLVIATLIVVVATTVDQSFETHTTGVFEVEKKIHEDRNYYLVIGDKKIRVSQNEFHLTDDDSDFPQRMFEYYYRIFDRYGKKIVAIALFTKPSNKSTNQYKYLYFGTELSYNFNKYVISDFDEEALKISPKLFSKALLASIYMNRSNKKMSMRSTYKRALLREVWTLKNTNRTEMSALLYFVDYLLKLPKDMSEQLQREMRAEIREEDEEMMELYKEDLPPTLAGILEMERKEGIDLGIKQVAKKMMAKGKSNEDIMDATDLTFEEIEALRTE